MREFDFSIIDSVNEGLRKTATAVRTSKGAAALTNFQIRDNGVEPYESVTELISAAELTANGIVVSAPFPQLFRGKDIMLLVTEDEVYEVDIDDFTLTQIETFDAYDIGETKVITADGIWHFADFYNSWFLYNGTSVVFRTRVIDSGFLGDATYVQDDVTIGTGTDFRGRLVTSGFDPSNFWNNDWEFAFECMKNNMPDGWTADELVRRNFVYWTSIAFGDTLWQFFPEMAFVRNSDGEFTVEGSRYLEAIERNDMGFIPMPFEGAVHVSKELGKAVIIYGKNGIAALIPVTDPAPTFALVEIADFGVYSRAAVGGDNKQHIFIDDQARVWRLKADLSLELLDYSEFVTTALSSTLNILYDPLRQEFYITEEGFCRLLGPNGMTTVIQEITAVINEDGKKGIIDTSIIPTTSTIQTNIISLGSGAKDTITSIEVDGDITTPVAITVTSRYDRNSTLSGFPAINLNDEGWVRLNITGVESQITLVATDYSAFKPDNITVKFKNTDKRNIRGIHVSKVTAR